MKMRSLSLGRRRVIDSHSSCGVRCDVVVVDVVVVFLSRRRHSRCNCNDSHHSIGCRGNSVVIVYAFVCPRLNALAVVSLVMVGERTLGHGRRGRSPEEIVAQRQAHL